jgi:hypothetical protein
LTTINNSHVLKLAILSRVATAAKAIILKINATVVPHRSTLLNFWNTLCILTDQVVTTGKIITAVFVETSTWRALQNRKRRGLITGRTCFNGG